MKIGKCESIDLYSILSRIEQFHHRNNIHSINLSYDDDENLNPTVATSFDSRVKEKNECSFA